MRYFRFAVLVVVLCMAVVCHARQVVDTVCGGRPKVALVLSGGGARGAAHIGAIRFIEEMGIPVDMVTGTSMGAIVGALYAIGYTADEMDSLLMTRDWKVLLSNGVPLGVQPYSQRMSERSFQVNIPYDNDERAEGNARYRDAGIRVRRSSERAFPKVLARPGLIDGQNLLNEFTQLTIAYHDSLDYALLPRPYACVATDLVSGEAVALHQGFLAESMRASMSIPGVFYPIYRDGMVLVDGGVVNNYPVDVARAMGADIVIGVDLSSGAFNEKSLRSFPAIFERLISTMGGSLRRRNVEDTDVLIRPQVGGFPVMGFDTVRLARLVDIGYETARQSRGQLEEVKMMLQRHCQGTDTGTEVTGNVPSLPANLQEEIPIKDIEVSGVDRAMMLSLLAQCGIEEGSEVAVDELGDAVEHIYGLGAFSSVQYHLLGGAPCTLRLEVVPNPVNQLELGVRLDSEDAAAALLGIGINRLALSGPKLDLSTRLGINPWVEGRVAYAWYDLPQVNASMKYWFSDVNRFYNKSSHSFDYHFFGADVYLSDLFSRQYDFRIGMRYDHFQVYNLRSDALPAHSYADAVTHESYIGLYASLRNNLFDAAYLPTSGYAYGVEAVYNVTDNNQEGRNFLSLQADASMAFALGSGTVVQPSAYVRWLLGDDVPFVYGNSIGGYLPKRYMRQQEPFVGLLGCEFMRRGLALFRLEARQPLVADLYLSATANYAYSADRRGDTTDVYAIWGLGLGLTYNTTVGPLMLSGHWNDRYHRFGAYFSFGYEF